MLKKPPAPPPGDLRSSASACLPVDVVANLVHMRVKMETGGKDEDGGAIAAELLVPGRGCFTAETTRSELPYLGRVVTGHEVKKKLPCSGRTPTGRSSS